MEYTPKELFFCLPFIVRREVDLFGDNQLVVLEHFSFFERSVVPQHLSFPFYLGHVCPDDIHILDRCLNLVLTSLLVVQVFNFRVWSVSKASLLEFVEGWVLLRLLHWRGGEGGIS